MSQQSALPDEFDIAMRTFEVPLGRALHKGRSENFYSSRHLSAFLNKSVGTVRKFKIDLAKPSLLVNWHTILLCQQKSLEKIPRLGYQAADDFKVISFFNLFLIAASLTPNTLATLTLLVSLTILMNSSSGG